MELSDWSVKRSGAHMTIEGRDDAAKCRQTVTHVVRVGSDDEFGGVAVATLDDGEKINLK